MRCGENQAMTELETKAVRRPIKAGQRHAIAAELIAVLVAVTTGQPRVMTIRQGNALPSGPFELGHRSLQSGLRDWVEQQTRHPLGYIEQLYTFADRDRAGDASEQRVISISYLALTREEQAESADKAAWRNWYDYFPWEDHRAGVPSALPDAIVPCLKAWADAADNRALRHDRWQRAAIAFGLEDYTWNEELALQRYELLYEAGFVEEAHRSHSADNAPSVFGRAMQADHRRILATGIARLRAKIKYRPVVFELMPPTFTLLQLQRSVEALAGRLVHKQNFRRLVEQQELVEETGTMTADTGGRPAMLFRFRHGVLAERAVAGTKLPLSRA
jgi:hypothetical protein